MYHLIPPGPQRPLDTSTNAALFGMLDMGVTNGEKQSVATANHYRGDKLLTLTNWIEERTESQLDWSELPGRWYFGGIHFNHFGHFLTETVHRIHSYRTYRADFDGIVFIKSRHMGTFNYDPFQQDFVSTVIEDYFNIDRSEVTFISDPTRVVDLTCEPQLQRLSSAPAIEYIKSLSDYSMAFAERHQGSFTDIPEKAFLSRSNYLRMGRTLGMSSVERVFQENGFEIIRLEEHPMAFQILLFLRAKKVAAEAGSVLHTLDILGRTSLDLMIISRRGHDASYWKNAYRDRTKSTSVFDAVSPLDTYIGGPLGKGPSIAHTGKMIEFLNRWGLNFDQSKFLQSMRDSFTEDLINLKLNFPRLEKVRLGNNSGEE